MNFLQQANFGTSHWASHIALSSQVGLTPTNSIVCKYFILNYNIYYKRISCIIESGDTDHVCHNFDAFINFTTIRPLNVKLPDETIAIVNYAGIIYIFEQLKLAYDFSCLSFPLTLYQCEDSAVS